MESLASCFSTNPSLLSFSSRKFCVLFVPATSSSCLALAFPASHLRRKPRTSTTKSPSTTSPTPTPLSPATTPTATLNPDVPTKKVLVPIGFGTEEMEAVVLIDVLRRAGAEVTVASVEPQLQIEASGRVKLVADTCISKCCDQIFDLVVLPGGMPGSVRLRDCEILRKITSKQAEEKRLYGAICAAPAVTLLPWGLLKRKQATCHPAFHDKLSTFWSVKTNLQVSGELTTSRGPGTSFLFALSLVDQLFGESVAREIGELLLLNTGDSISRSEEVNKVEWSFDHPPRILIPIANGCEEIEVVTIVDILRRAKVEVVLASVEKKLQILASQGTRIVADKLISDAAETVYDLIILPGGSAGAERLNKSRVLRKLLKEQDSAGRLYGALCSSLILLEKQGLLKDNGGTDCSNSIYQLEYHAREATDKRVTAHPSFINNNLGTEGVELESAKVVIDGKVITSVGLSCATDFVLAIVSKLFGYGRARSVAQGLVFDYPRSWEAL